VDLPLPPLSDRCCLLSTRCRSRGFCAPSTRWRPADEPSPSPAPGCASSEKGALGETGDIKPGTTKALTLSLKKGKYALVCNLPGHYKGGMYAGLTVK
jgi:hypothetical protein